MAYRKRLRLVCGHYEVVLVTDGPFHEADCGKELWLMHWRVCADCYKQGYRAHNFEEGNLREY